MEIQRVTVPKVSPKFLLFVGVLSEVLLALAIPSVFQWQPLVAAGLFTLLVAIAAAGTVFWLSTRKR
jgi:hypothetical protein